MERRFVQRDEKMQKLIVMLTETLVSSGAATMDTDAVRAAGARRLVPTVSAAEREVSASMRFSADRCDAETWATRSARK